MLWTLEEPFQNYCRYHSITCLGNLKWFSLSPFSIGNMASGYVKIAMVQITIDSWLSYATWWIFPVRYVNVCQRVNLHFLMVLIGSFNGCLMFFPRSYGFPKLQNPRHDWRLIHCRLAGVAGQCLRQLGSWGFDWLQGGAPQWCER